MEVIVVVGAGSIGQAIARRVSAGKTVLLADLRQENADAAAKWLQNRYFYLPVGNPAPDFYGEIRPGTNLYTNSVVTGNVCCRHKADVMSCSPR